LSFRAQECAADAQLHVVPHRERLLDAASVSRGRGLPMISATPRSVISRLVWLANVAIVNPGKAASREFIGDLAEIEADLAACELSNAGGVPTLVAALNELAHKTLVLGCASARLVAAASQARAIVRNHFSQGESR
jgi:hypothetical protein